VTETYEILAIKYGEFINRRRYESFIGADDHDGPHPITYYVWLIRSAHRTILVDCGFNEAEGAKRGRRIARTPAAALEMLGVGPSRVDQLIVSHLHYDHAGTMAAFPKARVIHCRRDPVDTCLSIYFGNFSNRMDFSFDREWIVAYYLQYSRLMEHWRNVLPSSCLLDIEYEELVSAPEPVIRRMIDFCGLEWDDACLSPEQNQRVIKTASLWQARQPIYGTSVSRWRRYEPWLGAFNRLSPKDQPQTNS
jgi:hypothetical protein